MHRVENLMTTDCGATLRESSQEYSTELLPDYVCISCSSRNTVNAVHDMTPPKIPFIQYDRLIRNNHTGQVRTQRSVKEIDLTNVIVTDVEVYHLVSAILHRGSATSGHYFTFTRRPNADYVASDEKVTIVPQNFTPAKRLTLHWQASRAP